MYIIELFFKIREKIKQNGSFWGFLKNILNKNLNPRANFSPLDETGEGEETCEHIFSAIDSTNTVLACTKCGFIIHTNPDDLKKKNIFEKDIFKES